MTYTMIMRSLFSSYMVRAAGRPPLSSCQVGLCVTLWMLGDSGVSDDLAAKATDWASSKNSFKSPASSAALMDSLIRFIFGSAPKSASFISSSSPPPKPKLRAVTVVVVVEVVTSTWPRSPFGLPKMPMPRHSPKHEDGGNVHDCTHTKGTVTVQSQVYQHISMATV